MIAAALLVASLANAPTVRVDIDALAIPHAEAEQLHGELMTRLVEAGHPVGSPGVVTVRLVGGGDALHIEVQHGTHVLTRGVEGKGAVRRLAVIHAALDLLTELEKDAAALDPNVGPPRDRFVIVDAAPGAERWLGEALRVLTDNGRVATSNPAEADWRVCVKASEDGRAAVAAARVEAECEPGEARDDLEAAILDVLGAATSVADDSPRKDPPAEPIAASLRPTPRPAEVSPRTPRPAETRRFTAALGAGIGAQGRLQEPEALVLVHGDARHARGGLLTLRLELAPWLSENVRTIDTWLTGGGGFAFAPRPKLHIEIAGTVGVGLHGYWVGEDRGTRADFAATMPLTIAGRLGRRLELGAQLVGGYSLRSRTHALGRTDAWTRDAWRAGGLVVFRILLGKETPRATIR